MRIEPGMLPLLHHKFRKVRKDADSCRMFPKDRVLILLKRKPLCRNLLLRKPLCRNLLLRLLHRVLPRLHKVD